MENINWTRVAYALGLGIGNGLRGAAEKGAGGKPEKGPAQNPVKPVLDLGRRERETGTSPLPGAPEGEAARGNGCGEGWAHAEGETVREKPGGPDAEAEDERDRESQEWFDRGVEGLMRYEAPYIRARREAET